jgi:ABC-type polysaccharide/polyol phosphate export permease
VGVIEGFRSSILGLPFTWTPILWSCVVSIAGAWLGLLIFRRVERRVADLI